MDEGATPGCACGQQGTEARSRDGRRGAGEPAAECADAAAPPAARPCDQGGRRGTRYSLSSVTTVEWQLSGGSVGPMSRAMHELLQGGAGPGGLASVAALQGKCDAAVTAERARVLAGRGAGDVICVRHLRKEFDGMGAPVRGGRP